MSSTGKAKETNALWIQRTYVVCLLAMVCTFLWGSAFPGIKLGYRYFEIAAESTWSQVLFAGIRFTIAGILVILIASVMNRRFILPTRNSLGSIVKLSCFQTILQYFFFYVGLARTSGVKSSIINGANTFIAILIASVVFHHEKLTMKKIVGCILGFLGVIIVNVTGQGMDLSMHFMGEGFILLCAVSYAVSSSLIKIYSKENNPVMLSGYQFIFGGIVLACLGWMLGGRIEHWEWSGVGILFYLAVVSAVAYSLWGILIKYNPVSKVAIFGFMNPVFGVILSAWWLGESQNFGGKVVLALLMVCVGIYIVNMDTKKV